jgi:hypothetical protein
MPHPALQWISPYMRHTTAWVGKGIGFLYIDHAGGILGQVARYPLEEVARDPFPPFVLL